MLYLLLLFYQTWIFIPFSCLLFFICFVHFNILVCYYFFLILLFFFLSSIFLLMKFLFSLCCLSLFICSLIRFFFITGKRTAHNCVFDWKRKFWRKTTVYLTCRYIVEWKCVFSAFEYDFIFTWRLMNRSEQCQNAWEHTVTHRQLNINWKLRVQCSTESAICCCCCCCCRWMLCRSIYRSVWQRHIVPMTFPIRNQRTAQTHSPIPQFVYRIHSILS